MIRNDMTVRGLLPKWVWAQKVWFLNELSSGTFLNCQQQFMMVACKSIWKKLAIVAWIWQVPDLSFSLPDFIKSFICVNDAIVDDFIILIFKVSESFVSHYRCQYMDILRIRGLRTLSIGRVQIKRSVECMQKQYSKERACNSSIMRIGSKTWRSTRPLHQEAK